MVGRSGWAQAKLADEPVDVLPTVQLDLAYNDGMSFGTGSGFGAVIGAIVILVLAYLVSLMWRDSQWKGWHSPPAMSKSHDDRSVLVTGAEPWIAP